MTNITKIYLPFQKKFLNPELTQVDNFSFRSIITFDSILERDKFVLELHDKEILGKFEIIPSICVVLTKEEIEKLENDSLVKRIEEDQKLHLCLLDVIEILEVDKYKRSQIIQTGKDVVVGILDNGINVKFDAISPRVMKHFRLNESLSPAKMEITHGTLMASVIANQYLTFENSTVGIAPNVIIFDLDVSKPKVGFYISSVLEMFDLIIKFNLKIHILLITFSTAEPSDGKDILSQSCNILSEKGPIIIAPTGNFGPKPQSIGSPGAAEQVITVGSTDKKGFIASSSGVGPTLDGRSKPDFYLPGEGVEIPLSNTSRVNLSGTSVSASILTGIVALLKEHDLNLNWFSVKKIISESYLDYTTIYNSRKPEIISLIKLFKKIGIFEEKTLPYKYLVKKSLQGTIEVVAFLIILFYLFFFIRMIPFNV